MQNILKVFPLAAVLAVGGGLFSCTAGLDPSGAEDGEGGQVAAELSIRSARVNSSKGSTFVAVSASSKWTLVMEGGDGWASLSDSTGKGCKADVILSYRKNAEGMSRSLTLCLYAGKDTVRAGFVQSGFSTGIFPDPVGKWMELPATDNPELYFITHPMVIDGRTCRNFSYYWDADALAAHWVAYPLNNNLKKGTSGRSEAWGLDPKIPEQFQPVLFNPVGSYQRGHQIPSADRQILEYNKQTYYGTNMTMQNGSLNTGTWEELEQYVRNRCSFFDTLYVATGCVLEGSTRVAYDNRGKTITVPTGYFKALLGYKRSRTVGITGSTGGYTGIAFFFDNASYSGSYMDNAMTIDDLEAQTGFDFFVNLPDAVGTNNAARVESTLDPWWTK